MTKFVYGVARSRRSSGDGPLIGNVFPTSGVDFRKLLRSIIRRSSRIFARHLVVFAVFQNPAFGRRLVVVVPGADADLYVMRSSCLKLWSVSELR